MAEKGNLIGRFLKQISGQAAKEERVAQVAFAQQRHQKEQRVLVVKAHRFQDSLTQAFDIPHLTLPKADYDYAKEAEQLDANVKARALFAKIPGGKITIHGETYTANPSAWTVVGDNRADIFIESTTENPHFYPLHLFRRMTVSEETHQGAARELASKHFITAVNVPATEDAIISYMFRQHHLESGSGGRYVPTVSINFLMDRDSSSRLLGLIRENPDFAEIFLQTAASGFEGGEGYPGINRIASDEIVIANLGNINRLRFSPFRPQGQGIIEVVSGNVDLLQKHNLLKEILTNDKNQIERYKYSQPFGKNEPSRYKYYC